MMRWKIMMSMILVSGHDDAENYDIVLKLREIKWSMSSLSNLRTREEKILSPMMMVWLFGDSARFMSGYVGGGVSRALKTPAARPRLLSRSDQLASPSVRLGHYSTKVDGKIVSSQCLEKSDRKKVAPKSTNSPVDERLKPYFPSYSNAKQQRSSQCEPYGTQNWTFTPMNTFQEEIWTSEALGLGS